MRKKMAAIVVLVGFLFLLAPALTSAPQKGSKFNVGTFFKKPLSWMSSLYDFISPYFVRGNSNTSNSLAPDDSVAKVKPLGDSISLRPSKGD